MIEDAIRSFLWGISKLVLIVGDWIYDMINSFITLNISSNKLIWYIYGFGLLFITFACFVRLCFLLAQKTSDDNEKIDIGKLGKRITNMFLVIAVIPLLFTFSLQIPNEINNIFNRSISMGEKMTPSTSILTSIAKTPLTNTVKNMKTNDETITTSDIDEKLNDEKNDKYIYFNSYGELFFSIVMGFLISMALVNVFVQIVERWFLQLFRLFIAFIPISSMVDPSDNSCIQWGKDILSDILTQTWTLIGLWTVFAIMELDIVVSLLGIIKLFMFWIGISSVSKIGELISKYLGASNLAKGNKLGSAIATMGMYGLAQGGMNFGKNAMSGLSSFMGNSAMGVGSGAIQKIGQSMGGKSMSQMGFDNNGNNSNSNSFAQNNMSQMKGDTMHEPPIENPLDTNYNSNMGRDNRLSNENTFARNWSDVAEVMPTNYGRMARGVSAMSSHIYISSSKRYNNTALRKAHNILKEPNLNRGINFDQK